MSWYDDGWPIIETEQERREREERERQRRVEFRLRQLACSHDNYYEVGHGCVVRANGEIFDYVTVHCPDCYYEDDIDKAQWQARVKA